LTVGKRDNLSIDIDNEKEFIVVREHILHAILVVPLFNRTVDRSRLQ
jgi:hypothetical protein